MIEWGVAAGTHDGSLTVVKDNEIVFASHSERYSRVKNDKDLNNEIVKDALKFGYPDKLHWYEDPSWKFLRKVYAGQKNRWLNPAVYMKQYGIVETKIEWGDHHKSHAAAGYYTSKFDKAAILVIDAIGEFTTTSIWQANGNKMKCKKRWYYPKSLGLMYSAFTDRVGLKANEDEYILMGMAAYGDPNKYYKDVESLWNSGLNFHRGIRPWRAELYTEQEYFDIAASVQKFYEFKFTELLQETKKITGEKNIVVMGGCALNCLANRLISQYFDESWIMPNPGDAGSSLGAILANKGEKINWQGPYLGYNIEGEYPVSEVLEELVTTGICGVANGRAEFGPRALGNRSLLADPRGMEMKDKVNKIKNRQEYRPFAPVIRLEDVHKEFNVEEGFKSPYMQYIVTAKRPKKYPAIVHQDGTSRVQTVTKEENPGLYSLLTKWKTKTRCPMLLNTSLNIKGQPIVNTKADAIEFEKHYKVKVF